MDVEIRLTDLRISYERAPRQLLDATVNSGATMLTNQRPSFPNHALGSFMRALEPLPLIPVLLKYI